MSKIMNLSPGMVMVSCTHFIEELTHIILDPDDLGDRIAVIDSELVRLDTRYIDGLSGTCPTCGTVYTSKFVKTGG